MKYGMIALVFAVMFSMCVEADAAHRRRGLARKALGGVKAVVARVVHVGCHR